MHQTIVGGGPEIASGCFEQVVDGAGRHAVFDAKAAERIAVEPGQPVQRAHPEESLRIAENARDRVVREAVGGGVDPDWQTLG